MTIPAVTGPGIYLKGRLEGARGRSRELDSSRERCDVRGAGLALSGISCHRRHGAAPQQHELSGSLDILGGPGVRLQSMWL